MKKRITKKDEPPGAIESHRTAGDPETEFLENQYSFIVESVPSGIVMTDNKGKIIFVNSLVNRMFGYEESELVGRNIDELVPDRYKKGHAAHRKSFLSAPETRPMGKGRDLFARRKNGSEFPVEIGLNPVKTERGLVVVSTIVDITDRRAAEIKLKEEQDRTQRYLDVAEVIFLGLDGKGIVTLINRKGAEILECSEEKILGKSWFDKFIPREERNEVLEVHRRVMRGESINIAFHENKIISESGKKIDVLWHNTAIEGENGRVIGTLSSGVDITDRKYTERRLQEREERLRSIMDNTTDAILVFDNDGLIETINKAALKLFAINDEDEIKNIHEIITPEHRDSFAERLERSRNGAAISDYETEMIKKDGSRIPVSISLVYMDLDRGKYIETIRDISARISMRKKIIELEKSQIIGKMAEGFAHHMGTPLASMLLRVQMLKEDIPSLPECESVGEKLDSIERQILYGQKVIQRLLRFVSQPGSEKSSEKVSSLLGESIDMVRPLLKKKMIEVELDVEEGLSIYVDSNLINLVFTDIIINAVDAMPDGGVLTVAAANDYDNGLANIRINDTGKGISKETISFVFEPFFTTKPAGKGTGLGLTVAKRIVNDHGGEVSIRSMEGKGTTVIIKLPLSAEGYSS
ncbi:MAG: PAS domain S-box protein [Deltaproteobacteria bacterium]